MALPVLDPLENKLNGNVDVMSSTELGKLLRWKGIPLSKMGKHSERKVLCKKTVDEGGGDDEDGLAHITWTDADEEESMLLRMIPSKWATLHTRNLRPRRRGTS